MRSPKVIHAGTGNKNFFIWLKFDFILRIFYTNWYLDEGVTFINCYYLCISLFNYYWPRALFINGYFQGKLFCHWYVWLFIVSSSFYCVLVSCILRLWSLNVARCLQLAISQSRWRDCFSQGRLLLCMHISFTLILQFKRYTLK